jgi:succinate dehydrogenase/fumarate reductase cytochrome b subunit
MLQKVLDHEIAVRKLIALALIFGIPYGIIGLIWAFNNMDHLAGMPAGDQVFSFLGEIVAWPLLIFVDITLR